VIGRAPGRGVYVLPEPEVFRRALSPKGIGRTFRGKVRPIPPEAVEAMLQDAVARLEARILDMIGIGRRAGLLELGMDPVARALTGANLSGWLVFLAEDVGPSTGRKLEELVARAEARGAPVRVIRVGKKQDLGTRLGRDDVGVIAMRPSRHTDRLAREADRWSALGGQPGPGPELEVPPPLRRGAEDSPAPGRGSRRGRG
jgi:ribosomal protein L7Ae-like RNA K-turn-binding protein